MQSTNQPAKFLIPFAQNDSARVEIPPTTTDPTRFSQEKGSPPLTGMPPEAGGVPPQLEDFNGALNQIARGVWWALGGGRFAYDATWATDSLIGGYARGAVLPAVLGAGTIGMGEWYNNAEANTVDPDVTGTGWVPGYHYGTTALTGQSGGTVTLTPAQAAKRVITVAGTLTSNLVLVVPGWVYSWRFVNNTGGAFTVTVKNAATSAVEIPQNGAATPVNCNGTQVSLDSPNIAPAVFASQAMQLGQATGRILRTSIYTISGGNAVVSVDGGAYSTTGAGTFVVLPATVRIRVRVLGGGGGGGGAQGTGAGQQSAGAGGAAGGYLETLIAAPVAPVTVTIGAGGAGASAGLVAGGAGGSTTFGALTATGGAGGIAGSQTSSPNVIGTAAPGIGTGGNIVNAAGMPGGVGIIVATGAVASGGGGASVFGGGGSPASNAAGGAARAPGAGGSGGACLQNTGSGAGGGAGGVGYIEIIEYA